MKVIVVIHVTQLYFNTQVNAPSATSVHPVECQEPAK